MFSVCLRAQFQANLREVHLSIVKRIFKYLSETSNLGLCYKARDKFNLQGYSNTEYVTSLEVISFHGLVRSKG